MKRLLWAKKALDGFSIKFEATDKNEVIAVNFIQPNGSFKASTPALKVSKEIPL